MAGPLLTILVPNYNRARALHRLLESVFAAIDLARAAERVRVLVVDDHSGEDLAPTLDAFRHRGEGFAFRRQDTRCGNAEAAFLNALLQVETEYCWLLGNDDAVAPEAVACVLDALAACLPGLLLLNPVIVDEAGQRSAVPILAGAPLVRYERGAALFADFGFVTSTTTFPCLVFRTAPVQRFHRQHRLPGVARVYSHSFTLFGALREEAAAFCTRPVVRFGFNDRQAEHAKLWLQAPGRVPFYHQTAGLARLVAATAAATGVPPPWFADACEDEVDKDSLAVATTRLANFLLHFFIEQLIAKVEAVAQRTLQVGRFEAAEVADVMAVVRGFGEAETAAIAEAALDVYRNGPPSPAQQVAFLRELQARSRRDAERRLRAAQRALRASPARKLVTPNRRVYGLRGRPADLRGMLG